MEAVPLGLEGFVLVEVDCLDLNKKRFLQGAIERGSNIEISYGPVSQVIPSNKSIYVPWVVIWAKLTGKNKDKPCPYIGIGQQFIFVDEEHG